MEDKALRRQGISHYNVIESSSGQGRPFLDHIQGGLIKGELKRPLTRQCHLGGSLPAGSQAHPQSQVQVLGVLCGHEWPPESTAPTRLHAPQMLIITVASRR